MSDRRPLFLDLDGPLLDVSARYYAVHCRILEEVGEAIRPDPETYWADRRRALTGRQLVARYGLSRISDDDYVARWVERIEAPEALELDRPAAGALHAAERLAQRYDVVLVTLRQERAHLLAQLEAMGIRHLLAEVLSASPLDGPGHETKAALVRASFQPTEETWLVGDTEIDVRAGKALGVRTAGLTCGIRDEERIGAEGPTLVLPDLATFERHLAEARC